MSASATSATVMSDGTRVQVTEKTGIHWSTLYLHTIPGALKAVCLICVLLGFVFVQCSIFSGSGIAKFYSTVSMIGFWFTAILLLMYLFHAVYVFNKIPWMKVEFFFCGGMMLLLLVSSALLASRGVNWFTAASFVGFVAMVAYGYDAFLKYKLYNTVFTNAVTRTTSITTTA